MANLSKVVKVTQEQYNTLINGGEVGGQTYDANAMYLVDDAGTSGIYVHYIQMYVTNGSSQGSYTGILGFTLITNSITAFTASTFISYVNNNFTSHTKPLVPSGMSFFRPGQTTIADYDCFYVEYVYGSSGSYINMVATNSMDPDQGSSVEIYATSSGTRYYISTFKDTVISL